MNVGQRETILYSIHFYKCPERRQHRQSGSIAEYPATPHHYCFPYSYSMQLQYNTIQLYFTTLATHNKSWFPGGA